MVLSMGDRLEVLRVDARSYSTQVVELRWQVTCSHLEQRTMDVDLSSVLATFTDGSVTVVVQVACPDPAAILLDDYLLHDADQQVPAA